MKLNARQVDAAKPKEKAYKLADGAGLYLEVVPSGSRYWRMKYRFNGKEKRMALESIQQCPLHKRGRYVMKPRKTGRGYRSIVCQERRKAGSGCAAP